VKEPDNLDRTVAEAYRLRADPRHWPLRAHDTLTDDTGRVFVVRTAVLVAVPGQDDVDFIRVTADLDPPVVE
jgi:hypothetical protein